MKRRTFLGMLAAACVAPLALFRRKPARLVMGCDFSKGYSAGHWTMFRWDKKDDGMWHPTMIDSGPIEVDPVDSAATKLQVLYATKNDAASLNALRRTI